MSGVAAAGPRERAIPCGTVPRMEAKPRPDRDRLLEEVRAYLRDQREIDPARVNEDTSFMDDLGIDSLDLAAMALALEDVYGVRLEDEQIMLIRTVGDALDLILESVEAGAAAR